MLASIMMIDDDLATLKLVNLILAGAKLCDTCLTYTSARQGMEALETHSVELILLDLSMPDMDGLEVLEQMKQNPEIGHIPVILLTAQPPSDYLEKALSLGAIDYIQKPIIPSNFVNRVRTHLQNQQLQRDLRNKNTALVHANQLKNDLLSICSHDLRSPLAAIDMLCQLMRSELTDTQQQKDALRLLVRIQRQSRIAKRLVEALLDLNRIEDGKMVWNPSFFQPASLLQECLDDEQVFIESKRLQCTFKASAKNSLLFGDRELMGAAIRNILGNAVKHATSTIQLTAQFNQTHPERGGDFLLSIENDGDPLAAGLSEDIFEKHSTTHATEGGRGLGLYIAKRAATLHQGEISVQTGAWGVRFSMVFPNAFAPNQLPDIAPLMPCSIWVASSASTTAHLLEGVLSEMGLVHVEQVLDPLSAQAKALPPPHCVVLDVSAPPAPWQQHLQLARYPDCALLAYGQTAHWKLMALDKPETLFKKVCFLGAPFNPLVFTNALLGLLWQGAGRGGQP